MSPPSVAQSISNGAAGAAPGRCAARGPRPESSTTAASAVHSARMECLLSIGMASALQRDAEGVEDTVRGGHVDLPILPGDPGTWQPRDHGAAAVPELFPGLRV